MSGEADKNNSFDEQNRNYQTISQNYQEQAFSL
ncbi:hypothetical protein T4D_8408 [Trichinella pseudospiralis]|uniref:Uncharacterized protein n=1 Tax=Trichinella pseudospiralis TaxID=6337 RepID=A0A0V1EK33_TRIPS|nr:hypothetical protein T4D_8408 [Trichinella pseudospiralis]